jgi:nitrate reductase NapE component
MSFNLDFTTLLETASDLVNGLWPVFVVPIGFALAFGLINWIYKAITDKMGSL